MTEHATPMQPSVKAVPAADTDRPNVNPILKDLEVARLIAENPNCQRDIEHAAELLRNKPDAAAAVVKSAQSLIAGKIKVFLSYKKKEEPAAEAVIAALLSATSKLDISCMKDIPHGTQYREWINEKTARANWFILLLPDPSEDWDWCLFESGLFRARMLSCDRLICLYHPDIKDRPSELEEFNHVPVTQDAVTAFLRQAFCQADALPGMPPINAHADVEAIAKKIVEAVSPPAERYITRYLTPCVTLEVADIDEMATEEGLDKARLTYVQDDVPDIFGKIETPRTWGELVENQREGAGNALWLSDLGRNIASALKGNRFENSQAAFAAAGGNAVYRAQVHGITRSASGNPKAIHVLFIEDVSAINLSPEHKAIASLAMLMRTAFRFRWEILERYGRGRLEVNDITGLGETLDRMQAEARASGMQPQGLLELFDRTEQATVINMLAKWNELRNAQGTGTLDVALRDGNAERVGELLAALSPINKEFLIIASRRFTELTEAVQA